MREVAVDYDHLPDPTFTVDESGYLVACNALFRELFGGKIPAPDSPQAAILLAERIGPDSGRMVWSQLELQFQDRLDKLVVELPVNGLTEGMQWFEQSSRLWENQNGLVYITCVWRDITAQVQARQFLARSEEKYRGIIQNSSLGLLEVDNNEVIQFANAAFCEISGYNPEDLVGFKANELLLPQDPEVISKMEEVQEKRSSGVANAYELQIRKKDGTLCWVLISGAPIYDHNGKVVGSIGIHHDITGQKNETILRNQLLKELDQRNAELQRQQEHLALLNRFASGLLAKSNIVQVYRHISDTMRGSLGFIDCIVYHMNREQNRLEHDPAFIQDVEAGRPGFMPMITVPLGTGITGSAALHGRVEMIGDTTADKRYIPDRGIQYSESGELMLDMNSRSVRNSELAVPIIYGTTVMGVIDTGHPQKFFFDDLHRDTLTTIAGLAAIKIRQLQYSESLRDSEQQVRAIIDSSLDAVMTLDKAGKILEATQQASAMFGWPRESMAGMSFNDLLDGMDRLPDRYFRQWLGDASDLSGKSQRIEVAARKAGGEIFQAELSMARVRAQGDVIASVFIRDITIQKQAEIELRTALAREAELNNMKTRFITLTSHEFRTPLTTIQSTAEILFLTLQNFPGLPVERLDKYMRRITGEVERLTSLMNDILVLGRIDAGKISFQPVELDVCELIQDLLDGKQFIRGDNRQVTVQTEGVPALVQADPALMSHVVTNLVSNALKYSPGKPTPEVLIKYGQDRVKICVQDYGIGIPEKDIQSIFDSFFRASNAEHIQGTGLGLVIVRQFLDIHGGVLHVSSKLGEGTLFCMELFYKLPRKSS